MGQVSDKQLINYDFELKNMGRGLTRFLKEDKGVI